MLAKAPVEEMAMYLNGFHVSKDDPSRCNLYDADERRSLCVGEAD